MIKIKADRYLLEGPMDFPAIFMLPCIRKELPVAGPAGLFDRREKMRYLKPYYYDDFCCLAGACPATCCAKWQIVIAEDSLDTYAKVEGPFGNHLRNSIDWEEGIFQQYDRRCAMLNEDGLCDLQTELGEEALCDTCRLYPRHVEEYEGLREYSLTLSCPEAARMILTDTKKLRMIAWETDEEDDFGEFDYLMFTQLEDAREIAFRMIQDRSRPLEDRMKGLLEMAREIQKCVDEQRLFDVDAVIETYRVYDRDGADNLWYENRLREFPIFYRLEHLDTDWSRIVDRTWSCLYEKGRGHYQKQWAAFRKAFPLKNLSWEQWEIAGEQMLCFFVYTYFCGAVYDDRVYSKMALSVFSVIWIREHYMAWWQEDNTIGMDELIRMAYGYAREVEHSDLNLDMLEEALDR